MKPTPPRPSLAARLVLAAVLTLSVVGLTQLPGPAELIRRLDALAMDWRFRVRGSLAPPADLVVLALREPSIAARGGWPVDRGLWAELVRAATVGGARTVVLDALFDPSREADDAVLAAAMRRHGAVVVARAPAAPSPGLPPILASAAAGVGHAALTLGDEGRLRGLPPFLGAGEDLVPALALEAVRVHRRFRPAALVPDPLHGARLARQPLAPADRGIFLLRSYGPQGAIPTVDAEALLVDPLSIDLRGRLVVVAVDAVAAGERFRTPFAASASGGEALATAIGNLLEGRTLREHAAASPLGVLAIALAALAGALALGRFDGWLSVSVAVGLLAAWLAAGQVAFVRLDHAVTVAGPLLAFALAAIVVEAHRLVLVQRTERDLALQRQNLGRFFTPAVADRVARLDRLDDLDRLTDATVMFVDLVGFTRFAERHPPAEVMAVLRAFLTRVETAVFDHGGTLVTFLGDGALACFGVPEPTADPQAQALGAARALVDAHAGPLPVSIGLHHGPVVMGNGGGTRQFQFTVLGDTVNVASRIEGLSRGLGASIVASSAVVEPAGAVVPALMAGLHRAPPQLLRGREGRLDLWFLPRDPAP